jgi:hypothetical protein
MTRSFAIAQDDKGECNFIFQTRSKTALRGASE